MSCSCPSCLERCRLSSAIEQPLRPDLKRVGMAGESPDFSRIGPVRMHHLGNFYAG